ncbi:MAG: type II toxin-antitoxin system VapC family toxin [Desulfobacteraceae bacterium]|nr:type II toxin-antitoxin system VapC family toxin [Desulfobacteraceae bacterium]MBC2757733.1 type II toxin-antitoxin system VapC family toxin [Desulfobacteraceae bacterium]
MNLFLDTNILLWWLDNSPKLSQAGLSAIADPDNLIILSAVVIWEMRIKQALGKLKIPSNFFHVIKDQGFEFLSITADHAYAVGELPMHHRDPFDRMIIAQAKLENLHVVTHDIMFQKYDIPVLEV